MLDKIFVIDRSDTRNLYLKKMLENDGFMVFDFEESFFYPAGHIVYVFAPSKKIEIDTAQKIRSKSTVFLFQLSGAASDEFLLRGIKAVCITDDEIFAYKNAALTAEGVLPIIIENTEKSLPSLNFLVMGLGRVGKSVCKVLTDLNLSVTPLVTTEEEKYMSCVYVTDNFVTLENFEQTLPEYSVIINTIPAKILTSDVLSKISSDSLIIDLASKPGGADYTYCKENCVNIIHALSLPGKTAPYDAARFLKERIYRDI